MNGARTKNALLLLLAVVDAILACVFVWRIASASSSEARAARDGAAALERLGFTVSAEMLSEEQPTLYTREKERSPTEEFAVASVFLGEVEPVRQGGGIYTAETEHGRIRISNSGAFELVLYRPYPEGIDADVTPQQLADYAAAARGHADSPEVILADGMQTVNGARVFGSGMETTEEEEGLKVSGVILLGEIYVSDGTRSKSLVAALLSLAGELANDETDTNETVLGAELGYVTVLLAEGYTELHPVWQIKTDVGEYRVDAVTLELLD